jgi:GT2 family glycosyltransferase
MIDVAIILPTFNRNEMLKNCLFSLKKQTYNKYITIVIDDGNNDETSEIINNNFNDIILLKGNGDLWWTGSVNMGIKYALENFKNLNHIVLLNDDVEVYQDYIENLVKDAEDNPDSLIGCVAVDIKQPNIIFWGGVISNFFKPTIIINKNKNIKNISNKIETRSTGLIGRGILIPKRVFEEIGLFDDKHFKQCGDMELPGRAKLKGYRLLVSYNAIVKGYVNESANIIIKKDTEGYRLRDFKEKFFSIKSNSNIKYIFYNRWNTKKNFLTFLFSFTYTLFVTIFWGFLKNVKRF